MSSLIVDYSTYAALQAAQKKEIWSEGIRIDARNQNVLKDFIGPEGSGKPFCEKRDLAAGEGQKVTFTTAAPFRAAGVIGEGILREHTGKFVYGEFSVTVDMRAFGIGHSQMLQYLRFNKGLTPKTLGYTLCKELWGRMEQDDLQIVARNAALFASGQPNVMYVGGGTSYTDLRIGDTFDTTIIETGRNMLQGQGATPLAVTKDEAGANVPKFLVFGPQVFLYPLENEQKFRDALNNAEVRGAGNPQWTAKYPMWKGNLVHRHDVVEDTANGRQGSPLNPIARLGVTLASGVATDVTGGGAYNTAGTLTDALLFDYFAYFPGYWWKTFTDDVSPTDNNTYYAMIYNVSGANRGKYEIVSYVAAGNNGNKLVVIRELDESTYLQKSRLTVAGRYSNVHPSGSLIVPCTRWGVPIGYALHTGAEALYMAKGAVDAERLTDSDDYENDSGEGRIRATGIQGIRGYAPFEDTLGRFANYLLIVGAIDWPGLNLLDLPEEPSS